ncbi:MAG TPA: hypothetical protein VHQ90_04060 [Thermoanaerobaculia bacterium]|nr:hypothetical protein [Thermoanaerobaculia bacterium]
MNETILERFEQPDETRIPGPASSLAELLYTVQVSFASTLSCPNRSCSSA